MFFTFAILVTALRILKALTSGDLQMVEEIAGTRDAAADPSSSTTARDRWMPGTTAIALIVLIALAMPIGAKPGILGIGLGRVF